MSEIKNVGQTWMALNTCTCNCLTPLHFKGLIMKNNTLRVYILFLQHVIYSDRILLCAKQKVKVIPRSNAKMQKLVDRVNCVQVTVFWLVLIS